MQHLHLEFFNSTSEIDNRESTVIDEFIPKVSVVFNVGRS